MKGQPGQTFSDARGPPSRCRRVRSGAAADLEPPTGPAPYGTCGGQCKVSGKRYFFAGTVAAAARSRMGRAEIPSTVHPCPAHTNLHPHAIHALTGSPISLPQLLQEFAGRPSFWGHSTDRRGLPRRRGTDAPHRLWIGVLRGREVSGSTRGAGTAVTAGEVPQSKVVSVRHLDTRKRPIRSMMLCG